MYKCRHRSIGLFLVTRLFFLFFAFASLFCQDGFIGIDGGNVIEAREAYKKLSTALLEKYWQCIGKGFKYSSYTPAGPGVILCNDKEQLKGQYLWTRSVNYCVQIVLAESCPPSDTIFDIWSMLLLWRCDLGEVYFINSKKPFEGKVLFLKGGLPPPQTICL